RWWQPLVVHGEAADGGLDGAGRAERVCMIRLAAGYRDAVGAFAEHGLERLRLGGVVEGCRRSVRADEVDVIGRDAGVAERDGHGASGLGSIGPRRGEVVGVVGGAVTGDLGVDASAA